MSTEGSAPRTPEELRKNRRERNWVPLALPRAPAQFGCRNAKIQKQTWRAISQSYTGLLLARRRGERTAVRQVARTATADRKRAMCFDSGHAGRSPRDYKRRRDANSSFLEIFAEHSQRFLWKNLTIVVHDRNRKAIGDALRRGYRLVLLVQLFHRWS